VRNFVRQSLTAQSPCASTASSPRQTLFTAARVDHIISLKHGGSSEPDNLAYACGLCNRAKGSDVGSVSTTGEFTRFFNPRTDRWVEHFRLEQATIHPLTTVGEATARILGFNDSARLHEREEMIRFGKYPSEAASAIMAMRST